MDKPLQTISAMPTKPRSKAIPIVDPRLSTKPPVIKPSSKSKMVKQSHSTSQPLISAQATSKMSETKSAPSIHTGAKTTPGYESEDDLAGENNGEAFNVYARPFVPEALSIINTLDGHKCDTPATNQINFGAYSQSYLGMGLLPPIPQPLERPLSTSCRLSEAHYEQYFRHHLEAEIKAQQEENESYSLYGHNVTLISQEPPEPARLSLLVPGLRENSPYIEEGDVIELRQLSYDHERRPYLAEQLPAYRVQFGRMTPESPATSIQGGDEAAARWTGIIYSARVLGVQRKQEQLLLTVCGIIAENGKFGQSKLSPEKMQLKFNVRFPVPMKRYFPMKHVLPITQKTLIQAVGCSVQDLNEDNSVDTRIQDLNKDKAGNTSDATSSPMTFISHSAAVEGTTVIRHNWLQSMLFPTEENCEAQTQLTMGSFNRPFFDKQLNWEQRKAIESICSQDYGALPFLISGPAGTGKTKTLVETALQLVENVDKVTHILFCAPSDPAADILIQRLSKRLMPAELLRLNRPSRTFAEVSGEVLPFCYVSQNVFHLPPFKNLMSFKIVVTTCRDASLLMYSRMTNSDLYAAEYGLRSAIHPHDSQPSQIQLHWSAVLIDEAAQAMEPEALLPLSVVAPPFEIELTKLTMRPLFVMAGDEHQLGPRLSMRSSPLKTSLFARLFARPTYACHPLARSNAGKAPPALKRAMLPILRPAFANLIRNYRSHPAILAVPSALFYADTLVPEATDTGRLASWSEWRGRRWPVLFHHNASKDELEKDGGGWYNVGEAEIACRYAAHLVHSGLVEQKEICIMSPFKAQVLRLRKTMRKSQYGSLWNVDIGPTEAFQGLERAVVILCTTRSKQRFLNKDKELGWGIVGMPDKMNVAITRAKFGLIVIGRREILLQDPSWDAFLNFCDRNGLVASQLDNSCQLHQNRGVKLTRLEKVLLAQERDLDIPKDSRALRIVSQDDEMWTSGMRSALDPEIMNGIGYSDHEEDE